MASEPESKPILAIFNLGTRDVLWQPEEDGDFIALSSESEGIKQLSDRHGLDAKGLYEACRTIYEEDIPGKLSFPILETALDCYLSGKGSVQRVVLFATNNDEAERKRAPKGDPRHDDTYWAAKLAMRWLEETHRALHVDIHELKQDPHVYENAWTQVRKSFESGKPLARETRADIQTIAACLSPGLPMVNFALSRRLSLLTSQDDEPGVLLYQVEPPADQNDLKRGEVGAYSEKEQIRPAPFSLLRLDYLRQVAPKLVRRFDYEAVRELVEIQNKAALVASFEQVLRLIDEARDLYRLKVDGLCYEDCKPIQADTPAKRCILRARLALEILQTRIERRDLVAVVNLGGDLQAYLLDLLKADALGLVGVLETNAQANAKPVEGAEDQYDIVFKKLGNLRLEDALAVKPENDAQKLHARVLAAHRSYCEKHGKSITGEQIRLDVILGELHEGGERAPLEKRLKDLAKLKNLRNNLTHTFESVDEATINESLTKNGRVATTLEGLGGHLQSILDDVAAAVGAGDVLGRLRGLQSLNPEILRALDKIETEYDPTADLNPGATPQ